MTPFLFPGTLDSSFGSGGIVLGAASNGVIRSILVEPDGTIFAGGDNNAQTMLEHWEYSPAGTLEQNLTSSAGTGTLGWSIAMGANGQIIVSGQSNGDAALAAFRPETLRLYGQHDAIFNTTAMVDVHGNVVQRDVYSPYGSVTVLSPQWSPVTGAVSETRYLFQGMRQDAATGLDETPNRDYGPTTGTWEEADPTGYPDGASRYQALGSAPTVFADAAGTKIHVCRTAAAYFKANGVGGVEDTPGDTPVFYGNPTYNRSDITSEILGTMIKSAYTFEIKDLSLANLTLHVDARRKSVQYREAEPSGSSHFAVGGPGGKDPATMNPTYWTQIGNANNGDAQFAQPATANDAWNAVNDFINPFHAPLYKLGCANAAQLALWAGSINAMGVGNLGQYFADGGDLSHLIKVRDTANSNLHPDVDWVPGDAGVVINNNSPGDPGSRGQFVTYLGDNQWVGFPYTTRMSIGGWIIFATFWNGKATLFNKVNFPSVGLK